MRYTIEIEPTGCYTTHNPSRSENGQPSETRTAEGTLEEAIAEPGPFRTAKIFDRHGDLVALVCDQIGYGVDGEELIFDGQ